MTNLSPIHIIRAILILALTLILGAPKAGAVKTRQQLCGTIYLAGGETISTTDSSRVAMPAKKHSPLVIVENAFTSRARDSRVIPGAETDSVSVWSRTRPDRPRTLVYLPSHGWCWQLERAAGISVLVFSPKGYFLAGNGGMSAIGKYRILVVKHGEITRFDKTDKMADDAFRRRVADLAAGDEPLARRILDSRSRRDRTLRMLGEYNPPIGN